MKERKCLMMNANAGKVTKREYFEILKEMVETSERADAVELIGFIDHELDLLAAKSEKAKARAQAAKEKSDALKDTIYGVLNAESYMTIVEILGYIEDEEVTRAKVAARLAKLVDAGKVVKDNVKNEEGKKVMGYRIALAEEAEDNE